MKLAFLDSLRRTGRRLRPLMVVAVAAMAVTLTGCVFDDELDSAVCNTLVGPDEYALNLTINLGSLPASSSTRAVVGSSIGTEKGLEYENYINTLKLLFFDKNDRFLFEANVNPTDSNVKELETNDYIGENNSLQYGNTKVYSILLRIKDYTEEHEEEIMQALEVDGFKVAVLANWPDKANADPAFRFGESINKLHHYFPDSAYNQTSYANIVKNENGTYLMGVYQDWVYSHITNETTAAEDLRAMDPTVDYTVTWPMEPNEHLVQHTYKYEIEKLISNWNFGGGTTSNGGRNTYYKLAYPSFPDKWYERSGKAMIEAWNQLNNGQNPGTVNGLTFPTTAYATAVTTTINGGANYGVELRPTFTGDPSSNKKEENLDNNFNDSFTFRAYATGALRIKAAKRGSGTVYVWFQPGENSTTPKGKRKGFAVSANGTTDINIDLGAGAVGSSINSNGRVVVDYAPVDVHIYCSATNASDRLIIYEIEFMEQKYFYDSNRDAMFPSKDNPIPMYGVQKFIGIGNYWEKGKVFDLFNGNLMDPDTWITDKEQVFHGEHKYVEAATGQSWENWDKSKTTIHLLRSLARVDLYIPKYYDNLSGYGAPSYVYMRSLNRHSRCEPMDVSTPTNEIWAKRAAEWDNICSVGSFRALSSNNEYVKRISWFYGNWKSWWTGDLATSVNRTPPSIINPRINRSDFARFVELKTSENEPHHYVFYLPEKYLDDPNTVGDPTSTPKVVHIEFRLSNKNTTTNLDDGDAYNIYFTDYRDNMPKITPGQGITTWADNEELASFINKCWPIMRNHIYSFNVTSISGQRLTRGGSDGLTVISSGPKDTFGIVDVDE